MRIHDSARIPTLHIGSGAVIRSAAYASVSARAAAPLLPCDCLAARVITTLLSPTGAVASSRCGLHLLQGHRADTLLDLAGLDKAECAMIQASIGNARDFDKIAPRVHLKKTASGIQRIDGNASNGIFRSEDRQGQVLLQTEHSKCKCKLAWPNPVGFANLASAEWAANNVAYNAER